MMRTHQDVSTVSPNSSASDVTVIRGLVRSPLDFGVSAMILPMSKSELGPKTYRWYIIYDVQETDEIHIHSLDIGRVLRLVERDPALRRRVFRHAG